MRWRIVLLLCAMAVVGLFVAAGSLRRGRRREPAGDGEMPEKSSIRTEANVEGAGDDTALSPTAELTEDGLEILVLGGAGFTRDWEPEETATIAEEDYAELPAEAEQALWESRLDDFREAGVSESEIPEIREHLAVLRGNEKSLRVSEGELSVRRKRSLAKIRKAKLREIELRRLAADIRKGQSVQEVVEVLGEPSHRTDGTLMYSSDPDGRLSTSFFYHFWILELFFDEEGRLQKWYWCQPIRD